jgi:hypothetical protein
MAALAAAVAAPVVAGLLAAVRVAMGLHSVPAAAPAPVAVLQALTSRTAGLMVRGIAGRGVVKGALHVQV